MATRGLSPILRRWFARRNLSSKYLNKASIERYTCSLGDASQFLDDGQDEGHAFVTPGAFRLAFRVARNQGTVGTWCGFRGAKHVDVFVNLRLERVGVDEAVDPHGTKEVSDSFADTARRSGLA